MRPSAPRLYPLVCFALALTASSQSIEELEQQLPACAASCVQAATTATGCPIEDFQCHCMNYAAMESLVGPCVQDPTRSTCTAADVGQMFAMVNVICAYYGVGSGLPLSQSPAAPAAPVETTSALLSPTAPTLAVEPTSSTPVLYDTSVPTTLSTEAQALASPVAPSLPPPAPPAVEASPAAETTPAAEVTPAVATPLLQYENKEVESVHLVYGMPTRLGDLEPVKPTGYVRPSASGPLPSASYAPIPFTGAASRRSIGAALFGSCVAVAVVLGVL